MNKSNPQNRSLRSQVILFLFTFIYAGGAAFCQQPHKTPENDTVYLLTYDHGGQILWGAEHFQERLNNAREWLDKYPEFKIGLENEAHVYDYFAANHPEILRQIKQMLSTYKGRFTIGSCTYGQPLSNFLNEESNVRQLLYAMETNRKYFHTTPSIYLMSEHAMHCQLPQILKGLGFKGAIMRTHFMMYGYNPTFHLAIGNWRGIDGTSIPAIPTYPGEGAQFGKTTIDNWILTRYPGPECSTSLEDYRAQFREIQPLLASRADDAGLRLEDLVKSVHHDPAFRWITLDELLSKYPSPTVDMITGPNDFKVRMPWGYCGNFIWNENRRAETGVLTAERLGALEYLAGGRDFESSLDQSWKNLLVGQHHDIQIVGLLSSARQYLVSSIQQSQSITDSALQFFAHRMKGEGMAQITVFNPLSWTQEKWISFPIGELSKGEAKNLIVKRENEEMAVRLVNVTYYSDRSIQDGQLLFKAKLPPLSVISYAVIPEKENVGHMQTSSISINSNDLTISTPFLELQLAPSGGIQRLKDKISNNLYYSQGHPVGFFEGTINGVKCQSSGHWIIHQKDSSSPFMTATEYGMIGGIPYKFEIKVSEDNPAIECKATFDFNGEKIGMLSNDTRDSHSPFVHDQKLRFKFFPMLEPENETGVRDLPFAVAETPDSNVEGIYWMAVSDGDRGVAFFNKGNMGSIRESDGSFSLILAYAMYYIWGTRMLNSSMTYEFAICPFSGNLQNAALHQKAIAYNFPTPYASSKAGNGTLGSSFKLFESASNDPLLSALYSHSGKVVMRFYEYQGTVSSQLLNLENKSLHLREITMDGGILENSSDANQFRPWQIKTFRIE